ncbi:MAG: hypothetical protein ACJ744_01325 [Gaiellaceae bacterium]|jgi:hypothetical protein
MSEPQLPGGWLPPRPPDGAPGSEPGPPEPHTPVFVQPDGRAPAGGRNGLAIAALVCAISSLALLVLSLGLSFALSLPLAGAGWICAAKARPDVQPRQRKAGLVLAIAAVALSVLAAVVWIALIAAGFSVQELQDNLQRELERQRRAGG